MRILKKAFALCLAGVLLLSLSAFVAVSPENSPAPVRPRYIAVTGTAQEIVPYYDADQNAVEGQYFVMLRHGEEGQARLFIHPEIPFLTADAVEAGDEVTFFYDTTRPMILIYPPQYTPVAVAVNLEQTIDFKTAIFDNTLLSDDGFLQLDVADVSEIIHIDGTPYTGSLAGKHVAVTYHPAMDAFPQKGRVIRAVVLDVDEETSTDDTAAQESAALADAPILVNGKEITAPAAYATEAGIIMVPLNAIATELGHTVTWDNARRQVQMGVQYTVTIDKDYYTYLRTAPIELGVAPVIRDNRTFVPLSYFTAVMRLNQAEYTDGQILISSAVAT